MERPPDRMEKAVRFGCGFLFALVTLGIVALRSGGESRWIAVLVGSLLLGVLAVRLLGDRFYALLAKWLHW